MINADMLKLYTDLVPIKDWKEGIKSLIDEYDTYLNEPDSIDYIPEKVTDEYESYIDYLIDKYDVSPYTPNDACKQILSRIQDIGLDTGTIIQYNVEQVGLDTLYITFAHISIY